jgi:hypothetical protein
MDERSVVRDGQPLPHITEVLRARISVTVWHERLAKLSKTIGIKPKENVTIAFELATKQS